MKKECRILYLEDREEWVEQVADLLARDYLPCDLTWVKGREALQGALKGVWNFDLLLVGEPGPGFPEQEALALVRRRSPDLPVILLPGDGDAGMAAESLRQGATDVVDRSALARLVPALRRALKEARDLAALRTAEADNARLSGMLRTVLEVSSEGLLLVDLAGKITAYNRKFLSLCGIPEYVMAPMNLDRVMEFLQGQFADPVTFLNEARTLGDQAERKRLGFLIGRDRRPLEAYGRVQRLGQETVATVFSFTEVDGRRPGMDPFTEGQAGPTDLVEAARAGRMVPWYLDQDSLVISDKGRTVLGLEALPKDLPGLEAIIHPADLDRLRAGLENPRTAPFELRLRRADGSWINTRWDMKRGAEGYRGVFTEVPGAPAVEGPDASRAAVRFNYVVGVFQES